MEKSFRKPVETCIPIMLNTILLAFAELQTDMSDLMSDLNVTGIPYWDYKNFTFKILFPGQTDHPSLHKLMVCVIAELVRLLEIITIVFLHPNT